MKLMTEQMALLSGSDGLTGAHIEAKHREALNWCDPPPRVAERVEPIDVAQTVPRSLSIPCLLYTSDAADDM
eukprot:4418567-Prymnesium_polylepis.1